MLPSPVSLGPAAALIRLLGSLAGRSEEIPLPPQPICLRESVAPVAAMGDCCPLSIAWCGGYGPDDVRYISECVLERTASPLPLSLRDVEASADTDGVANHSSGEIAQLLRALAPHVGEEFRSLL